MEAHINQGKGNFMLAGFFIVLISIVGCLLFQGGFLLLTGLGVWNCAIFCCFYYFNKKEIAKLN